MYCQPVSRPVRVMYDQRPVRSELGRCYAESPVGGNPNFDKCSAYNNNNPLFRKEVSMPFGLKTGICCADMDDVMASGGQIGSQACKYVGNYLPDSIKPYLCPK